MDEDTGIITVTKLDGTKIVFDLNIEKIPVKFSLSDAGILTMTTEDGTQYTADIDKMIPVLVFQDSDNIGVEVTGEGRNKTYSFFIKGGSVTTKELHPDVLGEVNKAEGNAILAKSYAVGGTGSREGEDTDNANYYKKQAQSNALSAQNSADNANRSANSASEYAQNAANAVTQKIINNLLATTPGYVLDATQGKVLNDKIEAMQENGVGGSMEYYAGTCSTAASTAAKEVTISGFKLKVGAIVHVKFSYTNTSSAATLNVSSTGAKAMYYMNGDRMYYIPAELYHSFIYDGTYWRYIGTLNTIISDRSYERYGVKMSGNSLIPINSSYRPTIGTSSNKFGYIHSDGLDTGSVNASSVVTNSVKTKVSGSEVELLPPYPLMKGHFLAPGPHSITLDSNVTSKYVKSYNTSFIQNGAGANSAGCALPCTAYAAYEGLLKLRFVGYDTDQSGKIYPFSEDVVLSTSQNYYASSPGCPGQTTAYKAVTLPGGNTIQIYVTGFYACECGYISGSPTITFTSWSNMVHFLEIDLMP